LKDRRWVSFVSIGVQHLFPFLAGCKSSRLVGQSAA
jgi:hypothetical protein